MDTFYEGKIEETGKPSKRSQIKLGSKFSKNQTSIGRQIQKIGINDYAREKTPKYTEENKLKAKKRCRKLVNLLYQS